MRPLEAPTMKDNKLNFLNAVQRDVFENMDSKTVRLGERSANRLVIREALLSVERIDSRINKSKCTIDSKWPCPKINYTSVSH